MKSKKAIWKKENDVEKKNPELNHHLPSNIFGFYFIFYSVHSTFSSSNYKFILSQIDYFITINLI